MCYHFTCWSDWSALVHHILRSLSSIASAWHTRWDCIICNQWTCNSQTSNSFDCILLWFIAGSYMMFDAFFSYQMLSNKCNVRYLSLSKQHVLCISSVFVFIIQPWSMKKIGINEKVVDTWLHCSQNYLSILAVLTKYCFQKHCIT